MRKFILYFLFASSALTSSAQKSITLEDIWLNNTFASKGFAGFNFMKNGSFFTEVKENNLIKRDVKTGDSISTLIHDGDIIYESQKLRLGDFEFSGNESRIVMKFEGENIYRRSVKYLTYVYDLNSKKVWKISNDKVLHATFNSQANKVAYVKSDNNIYI